MILIVPKPLKETLNENPVTIGDQLRNRRLELRLFQSEVAIKIGVSEDTITFWENNKVEPLVKNYPKIIQFLGYFPFALDETTLGGRIKKYRFIHGLSQEDLSRQIGVDESTIFHYENNKHIPSKKIMRRLKVLQLAVNYK
jgi:DNA-binding XRE family transcriptional regulator